MQKYINYTYESVQKGTSDLVRQMAIVNYVPEIIFAPSRGGLMLGTMLSHYFTVPLVPFLWQTRDGDEKDVDFLTKHINTNLDKNILVVDDICDTGTTFRQIAELFPKSPNVKSATWWWDPYSGFAVDFYAEEKTEDKHSAWIEFPYENWWR